MKAKSTTAGNSGLAYGSRWGVLALFVIVQITASLVLLSFGPLAVFLQADLKISRAQLGLFTGAVYMGSLLAYAFAGWLIDRFGVRRFILLGPGLVGLFFLATARTPSFEIALAFVCVGGAGYAFINPTTAKALTGWFTVETRATAMGIKQSGVNLGGALGAAVLPALSLMLGWRHALSIFAALVLVVSATGFALYREPPHRSAAKAPVAGLREYRRIMANRGILLVGSLGAAFAAMQLCLSTYLVLFLKEVALLPVVIAGTCLTVASLSGAAGRVLCGLISDRMLGGRRKEVLSAMAVLAGGTAVAMAFLVPVIPLWLLYVTVAVFGFAALGWNAVQIAFLAELAGVEQAGSAVGFGLGITTLGAVLGPPLFGYVLDLTSSYTLAWVLLAVIVTAGAILMMLLIQEDNRPARAGPPG